MRVQKTVKLITETEDELDEALQELDPDINILIDEKLMK